MGFVTYCCGCGLPGLTGKSGEYWVHIEEMEDR